MCTQLMRACADEETNRNQGPGSTLRKEHNKWRCCVEDIEGQYKRQLWKEGSECDMPHVQQEKQETADKVLSAMAELHKTVKEDKEHAK